MFLLLGLPRAIAVALISQTNLRSSFSVLQVLPYIIYFCRYCAWTWQKKARSDQIDHCPQLKLKSKKSFGAVPCSILSSCWDFWPSRNHDKPADRWPDTKMIANFSHVTARYNCKDHKSEIWRCNAVWEFNTLPLSTWPTSPHLAMLWRIFAALNFKYFQIFENLHFCANSWNSTIFEWVFVKTC